MALLRASARLRCAAASSRAISSVSAACSLSCPIFSKFAKLSGVSYKKNLRLADDARDKAVAGLGLRAEGLGLHSYRIYLAAQPRAGAGERFDDLRERSRSDHHQVDVARCARLALPLPAEDERDPHFLPHRATRIT